MNIFNDSNSAQKKFQGKIAGSKGAGYAEIFLNKEVEKFLRENISDKNTKIIIYTDGSSRGNPGPGGFGAIIFSREKVLEIGGREEQTTNNRMEMKAAIEALKIIPENSFVELHADSEYLIKGITIWIKNWQKNNWRTKDKREVLNRDLWEELLAQTENKNIEWKKVVGHSGHEFNDRCDEIATSFADGLNVDFYNGSESGYFLFHQ
ncbi:MAG: ribonuclease HI [Patescibacteria group bacterium]